MVGSWEKISSMWWCRGGLCVGWKWWINCWGMGCGELHSKYELLPPVLFQVTFFWQTHRVYWLLLLVHFPMKFGVNFILDPRSSWSRVFSMLWHFFYFFQHFVTSKSLIFRQGHLKSRRYVKLETYGFQLVLKSHEHFFKTN